MVLTRETHLAARFLLTIGRTILMKPDVIANRQYLVLVLPYDAADSLWWYARTVRPGGSSNGRRARSHCQEVPA